MVVRNAEEKARLEDEERLQLEGEAERRRVQARKEAEEGARLEEERLQQEAEAKVPFEISEICKSY